jgi:hypothetical protein
MIEAVIKEYRNLLINLTNSERNKTDFLSRQQSQLHHNNRKTIAVNHNSQAVISEFYPFSVLIPTKNYTTPILLAINIQYFVMFFWSRILFTSNTRYYSVGRKLRPVDNRYNWWRLLTSVLFILDFYI